MLFPLFPWLNFDMDSTDTTPLPKYLTTQHSAAAILCHLEKVARVTSTSEHYSVHGEHIYSEFVDPERHQIIQDLFQRHWIYDQCRRASSFHLVRRQRSTETNFHQRRSSLCFSVLI